jgi:hypothetical protein
MSIVTQFDLLRIQDERLEDEYYNSNTTASRLKRACQTADLPSLIECMEAEDFVNDGVINTLISSYNENMSEQFLDCIQFVVENGCVFDSTIFDELSIYRVNNNDIIYYLLSKFNEVNTEEKNIYSIFNVRGYCLIFKKYFRELLEDGKINTQEERWKTLLKDLVNNCPKMAKSLTDTITRLIL